MAQLLSNLPVGAKVKFGKHSVNGETAQPITWMIVAKNHTGYPSNSVTLLTEKIIDLRVFDTDEPTNPDSDRALSGNNDYVLSNIARWLNSENIAWYTPSHSYDTPPDDRVDENTRYDTRPGFLTNFTADERNAILLSTLNVYKYNKTIESFTAKIFLPSVFEVKSTESGAKADGSMWSYFNSNTFSTTLTEQCFNNTLSTRKPAQVNANWYYWFRTASSSSSEYAYYCTETSAGAGAGTVACSFGGNGVRPALNLSSSLKISDSVDSDGCYTVAWNSAPNKPSTINVPTIYGGKSNTISWASTTDPDGDAVTYQLECSVNEGGYELIYKGTDLSYAHVVTFGTSSVAYRVKAIDPSGESSAYTTSAKLTVVNNNAPAISGSDANLGVKSEGFAGTYTITDANNNAVTVTEAIDGVQIRAFVATLGATNAYGITGNTWLALPNGSHTLTIRATDGIDTTVRTYTFTKLVNSFTIQNSTPWAASTMPSRIMLVITRNIPSTSTFKVEVCNNGNDASPTWEDCTDAVRSGLVHVFANTTKIAPNWGVRVKVTVERNGATGACYISAIGGNFE